MLSSDSAAAVEAVIGYTFRNKKLLYTAFTHSSYANEHGVDSNERLEFLGDSILNFIIAERLVKENLKDEGRMSVVRSRIVSERPLAYAVERMKLTGELRLGAGAQKMENLSLKFKSNLFEAVIAAIYLDSESLDPCREFIFAHLGKTIDSAVGFTDYKTVLQEYVQSRGGSVGYETRQLSQFPPRFTSEVTADGKRAGSGEAGRKKDAEQAAAKSALAFFGVNLPNSAGENTPD